MTNIAVTRKENDQSHQISNSTSYQEPVNPQHNSYSLSEIISSDPYLSHITYIQDVPDNISTPEEDNSTPQL